MSKFSGLEHVLGGGFPVIGLGLPLVYVESRFVQGEVKWQSF